MSGTIYQAIDYTGSGVIVRVRAASLYDPSGFFTGSYSGERHGLGVIKLGQDVLTPSCSWTDDICCYVDGAMDYRDRNCPYVSYAANQSRPAYSSGLAVRFQSTAPQYSSDPPIGHYFSRTARRTNKFKARDYDSYDTMLHRTAGVDGVWEDLNLYPYTGTARGSLYSFDISNMLCPTICALFAVKDVSITGIYIRHDSDDPSDYEHIGGTYVATNTDTMVNSFYMSQDKIEAGPLYTCTMRRLEHAVTISGEEYTLMMCSYDPPRTARGTYQYVESPWWKVERTNLSTPGKVYFLDECVTIHKPLTW